MQHDKWLIAVYALEVFQSGIWPSEELIPVLEPHVAFLRSEYEARKWKIGFMDASRVAKVAFLKRIEELSV